jgi:hypothetical protein
MATHITSVAPLLMPGLLQLDAEQAAALISREAERIRRSA